MNKKQINPKWQISFRSQRPDPSSWIGKQKFLAGLVGNRMLRLGWLMFCKYRKCSGYSYRHHDCRLLVAVATLGGRYVLSLRLQESSTNDQRDKIAFWCRRRSLSSVLVKLTCHLVGIGRVVSSGRF